jgi:hypothetical protein
MVLCSQGRSGRGVDCHKVSAVAVLWWGKGVFQSYGPRQHLKSTFNTASPTTTTGRHRTVAREGGEAICQQIHGLGLWLLRCTATEVPSLKRAARMD